MRARRRTLVRFAPILIALGITTGPLFQVLNSGPTGSGAATPSQNAVATLPPAPMWPTASGATPSRPSSCPPVAPSISTASTTAKAATMPLPVERAAAPKLADTETLTGDTLWPPPPTGLDPEDYPAFDHTPVASPPVTPANFSNSGGNWKLSSQRTGVTSIDSNPQELCGVEGSSTDVAWQTSTGRPTTVIAVLDSGIKWCESGIVDKLYLNRAALPLPENGAGETKAQLEAAGQSFTDDDPYDLVDSGVFDVAQYAGDPRVTATAAAYGGYFCASHANNGYTGISPEDLIRTFADPTLPGGAANPYAMETRARPGTPRPSRAGACSTTTTTPTTTSTTGTGPARRSTWPAPPAT